MGIGEPQVPKKIPGWLRWLSKIFGGGQEKDTRPRQSPWERQRPPVGEWGEDYDDPHNIVEKAKVRQRNARHEYKKRNDRG